MMEAMRILKAVGAKPRRTIRIGLWGGEEEGLMGSRAYVREHLADSETMQLKPEHAKLSAYFNSTTAAAASAASGCRATSRCVRSSSSGSRRCATSA